MKNLKIYFTSDLHGYVYPTDYVNRKRRPFYGNRRYYKKIKERS